MELREARLGCYMSVLYVCLNSMLFGVEIWDLNDRDLQALESAGGKNDTMSSPECSQNLCLLID